MDRLAPQSQRRRPAPISLRLPQPLWLRASAVGAAQLSLGRQA